MSIPTSPLNWTPSFRIISTRYPAVDFFEGLGDPGDWEELAAIVQLTDPSLKIGDLSLLEADDRISVPGAGRILPSFTFLSPSRFNSTTFGAFYTAIDLNTAIAETVHHRTMLMLATSEPAQDLDQLLILADIDGNLSDVRDMRNAMPHIYHPIDYSASQAFAASERQNGSTGIVYESVRRPAGQCAAIWRARIILNAREDRHLTYRWDGAAIHGYYDKSNYCVLAKI